MTDTARAVGIATYSGEKFLDVWYPDPLSSHHAAVIGLEGSDAERRTERRIVETVVDDLSEPPMGPADAYLRLHLLSHRVFKPHEINVDGIFAALNNVVWTSEGPCDVEGFTETRARLIAGGVFVMSGTVQGFTREEAKMAIEARGGKATGSVSGRTSALVVGESPGASKSRKAEELGVPIIDAQGFRELLEQGLSTLG